MPVDTCMCRLRFFLVGYFTALPTAQNTGYRRVGSYMDNELEGIWKEVVVAYLDEPDAICLTGMCKSKKKNIHVKIVCIST
jgi:hypothetical protein